MTNREAFATSLAILAASFDRKLPPEAIEGYWLALKDATETEFALATKTALQQCEFMPAPARLLAYVRAARASSSLVAATDRRAAEVQAWTKRPAGRELEAVRETIRELAEMKALDEKGS